MSSIIGAGRLAARRAAVARVPEPGGRHPAGPASTGRPVLQPASPRWACRPAKVAESPGPEAVSDGTVRAAAGTTASAAAAVGSGGPGCGGGSCSGPGCSPPWRGSRCWPRGTTTKRNRGTFSGPPGGVAARHPHRHHPVQRRCQFTAVQGRVHALQATAARGGACTVDREPHRFSEPSGRFGARQCPGPRLIRPGAATPTNGKDEGMNHRMRGVIRAGTAALLSHPGRVRAGPCFWAGRASWQTAAKPRARPGAAPQSAGACPAGRLRHRWIVAWMARMGGQDAAAGRLAVRTG